MAVATTTLMAHAINQNAYTLLRPRLQNALMRGLQFGYCSSCERGKYFRLKPFCSVGSFGGIETYRYKLVNVHQAVSYYSGSSCLNICFSYLSPIVHSRDRGKSGGQTSEDILLCVFSPNVGLYCKS